MVRKRRDPKEWTAIPVKKDTRDDLNYIVDSKELTSYDEYLSDVAKTEKAKIEGDKK
jgi:hypothetical protein